MRILAHVYTCRYNAQLAATLSQQQGQRSHTSEIA